MKTSRYIHLTILVFIFGATLTLFINAKNHEEKSLKKPKANSKYLKLPLFSVIVAQENTKIKISKSISNFVICIAPNNEVIPKNYSFDNFLVKNDTLFVTKTDEKYDTHISVENVKSIIGLENSKIKLNDFYADSLQIDLTKSRLTGHLKADSINYFSLNAKKQSYVNINRPARIIRIDNVTKKEKVIIENANLKNATINLKNITKLWMPKPKNVTIKTDSLSSYNLNN